MNAVVDGLVGGFTCRQILRDGAYALLAVPIATVALTVVSTLLSVGASLAILLVGIGIIALTPMLAAWAGHHDARLANRLIGARVKLAPAPPRPSLRLPAIRAALSSRHGWRAVVWFLLRTPLSVVALLALTVPVMAAWALIVAPFWGVLYDASATVRVTAAAAGVAALLLIPHALRGASLLHASVAGSLLGGSLREQLAQATQRTATAEARADIARDLHDSVGHSVTAALLQASAARRMLATDPAYADRALAAIEEQGRAALEELDRVLAAMRDDGPGARAVEDLAQVDRLVTTARAAGHPVDISRSGDLSAAPAAVSRVGFRVVQEGLTNAMRHAAGARTLVRIEGGVDEIIVEVVNPEGVDVAPTRRGGGGGITGLRERVRAVGGELDAGPSLDGGFRLGARMPYRSS